MVWARGSVELGEGKGYDLSLCSFIQMPPQLPERHKVAEAGLVRPVGVRKTTQRRGAGRESPGLGWQDTALDWGGRGVRRPGPSSALCSEYKQAPDQTHSFVKWGE